MLDSYVLFSRPQFLIILSVFDLVDSLSVRLSWVPSGGGGSIIIARRYVYTVLYT